MSRAENPCRPQHTYDEAGLLFLQELRKEIGSRRIFGNQAYRLVEGYYDMIDYFLDLGKTLGPSYAETPDAVARYFANGFVVLTRSNGRVVFRPDPTCLPADLAGLWDAYEGTRVHDWQGQRAVTIHPAYYPSTQSYYPSGRVYLYLR